MICHLISPLDVRGSEGIKLIDTGEDTKLVHRRKRPEVATHFSSLFSDAFEGRA